MKNRYSKFILITLAIIAFVSCGPDPAESLSNEESDVVVTLYSDTTDFSRFSTYSIVDSVLVIGDEGEERKLETAEKKMLETIKTEMANKGYVLVDTVAGPDLFIDVKELVITSSGTVWYPGYGGGCWYYPCYGGWYPSYGYTYTYETGSIVIDMFSRKGELAGQDLYFVPWNAFMQGVLSNNRASNNARIVTNIQRAFDQSSYLRIN